MSYSNMTPEQKKHRKEYMKEYRKKNKLTCKRLVQNSKKKRDEEYKNAVNLLSILKEDYPQIYQTIMSKSKEVVEVKDDSDEYCMELDTYFKTHYRKTYNKYLMDYTDTEEAGRLGVLTKNFLGYMESRNARWFWEKVNEFDSRV
jgi:hypothetical protein